MSKRLFLTAAQAAEYVGFSKATIYEYVSQKKIPHYKVGGRLRFDPDQLDAWIEKQKVPELVIK